MRFHKIAGILLLLSCCGWASIILPTDSSFETPNVSVVLCGPSGFDGCEYRPTGYGWFFTGSSGVASNGGVFGLDSPGNDNPAPDGNQAAFLQFDPSNPASFPGDISQTVTGLSVGQSYVVSFEAASRPDAIGSSPFFGGEQDFDVLWNGSSIGYFFPTLTTFSKYFTASFTATATTGLLAFLAIDTLGGDRTAFIDSVQVDELVPEPSNGLVVLSGIGLIGLGLRRGFVRLICNRIWAGCKWYRNTLPVRFQTLQYSRGLPVLRIMLGMREPEIKLGCTRNRLLNRISDRLRENAMKVHRRDLKLLAYGEMLTSLKEDLRQQREERRAEALEPAAA